MPRWRHAFREYGLAVACVIASIACAFLARPYVQLLDLVMIQVLGIVLLSLRFSVRASIFAALVSVVALDFFFIAPRFAFAWTDVESGLTFVGIVVVAAVISSLNKRLRNQEQVARATAFRAETLYELNVELSSVSDTKQLAAVTTRYLERLFSAEVTILLRSAEGWVERPSGPWDFELAERAWVRREFTERARPSGVDIWLPISGIHAPLGVIGLKADGAFDKTSKQGFLLSACANQLATSIERVQLANAMHRTQLEAETERLRSSLLSAVSHDLKTPLSTIIAAGTTLMSRRAELDSSAADDLLSSIVSEGERLTRLIENLLSIARLESPTIELRRTPEAIEEIVLAAIEHVGPRLRKSRIQVDLEADLPLVSAEPLLLEQVLVNLLENAGRYAGVNATIFVHACVWDGVVSVQVADDGPGISQDERDKVFEKFYRGRHAGKSDGGVGLGLTICRAIVRAHGGRISLRERSGGGALIEFTLPVAAGMRSSGLSVEGAALS